MSWCRFFFFGGGGSCVFSFIAVVLCVIRFCSTVVMLEVMFSWSFFVRIFVFPCSGHDSSLSSCCLSWLSHLLLWLFIVLSSPASPLSLRPPSCAPRCALWGALWSASSCCSSLFWVLGCLDNLLLLSTTFVLLAIQHLVTWGQYTAKKVHVSAPSICGIHWNRTVRWTVNFWGAHVFFFLLYFSPFSPTISKIGCDDSELGLQTTKPYMRPRWAMWWSSAGQHKNIGNMAPHQPACNQCDKNKRIDIIHKTEWELKTSNTYWLFVESVEIFKHLWTVLVSHVTELDSDTGSVMYIDCLFYSFLVLCFCTTWTFPPVPWLSVWSYVTTFAEPNKIKLHSLQFKSLIIIQKVNNGFFFPLLLKEDKYMQCIIYMYA